MAFVSIGYGVIMILIGVGFFLGTGSEQKTALIPAYIGAVAVVLGFLARNEKLLKHTMHAAALLGLLTIAMTTRKGVVALVDHLANGTELARPAATWAMSLSWIASVLFVVLCVNSFIQVRRARRKAAAGA